MSSQTDLIQANFLFVDIVGLSDPKSSTKNQIKKIQVLNSSIQGCDVFKSSPKENLLVIPTGDGMCVGFLQGPEKPLVLAIQLHKKLAQYNKAKIPSETVNVRIGLHSGICYLVDDLNGNKNLWGPGIVIARRVMDVGDDGHILISQRLAEDLREISDEFAKMLRPLHDYTVKHGLTMLIYSAYGDGFGNPKIPTKNLAEKSRMPQEIIRLQKTTIYPLVEVSLQVRNPKTMLVHHKRTYEIENISDEPIKYVLHGIGTDIAKESLDSLGIKVYDESGAEMKISSISMNKLHSKEFSTQFGIPIVKGDSGRKYTIEYEVEEPERYFENSFLVDCKKFVIGFSYPKDDSIKEPVLYEVMQENEVKKKFDGRPEIQNKDSLVYAKWHIDDISKGTTFRIEW